MAFVGAVEVSPPRGARQWGLGLGGCGFRKVARRPGFRFFGESHHFASESCLLVEKCERFGLIMKSVGDQVMLGVAAYISCCYH